MDSGRAAMGIGRIVGRAGMVVPAAWQALRTNLWIAGGNLRACESSLAPARDELPQIRAPRPVVGPADFAYHRRVMSETRALTILFADVSGSTKL